MGTTAAQSEEAARLEDPENHFRSNLSAFWQLKTRVTSAADIAMARESAFGNHWLCVTWSLAMEEQFYVFLPPLILLTSRKLLPLVLSGCIVLAIAVRFLFHYFIPNLLIATYVLTPCRADAVLLGVLGAWAVREPRIMQWLAVHRKAAMRTFMSLFVGVVAFAYCSPDHESPGMACCGQTWFALFYVIALLIAVTFKDSLLALVMRPSPLRFFGRISYGIYLFHLVALSATLRFLFPATETAPSWQGPNMALLVPTLVATVLTLAAAVLLHYFVETPCLKFGHRLCRFWEQKPTGSRNAPAQVMNEQPTLS